jgi:retrograde regulation protein 2
MLQVNESFDGKIFGMSKRRRAQFPAIVEVVEALIASVPLIRSVTFCSGGNREGALMMSLPSEIRESNPLTCSQDVMEARFPPAAVTESASTQDVLDALQSAFPADLNLAATTTVFGLQLGPLYAGQIWTQLGADADANASAALHKAVSSPDQPGLTHLARAVLGVTLCARWGASLAPIDQQLHQNLRALMDAADPDATFWADYTGAVTATIASVVRTWPKEQSVIKDTIRYLAGPGLYSSSEANQSHRFRPTAEHGKKLKLHLDISISEEAARGVDLDSLLDLFKSVKRQKHDGKKVTVAIKRFP